MSKLSKPVPLSILLSLTVAVTVSATVAAASVGVFDSILKNGNAPLINGTIVNNDNKTYGILIIPRDVNVTVPTVNETQPPIINDTIPPIINDTIPPIINDTIPPVTTCGENEVWINETCECRTGYHQDNTEACVPDQPPVVNATTQKIILVGDVENSKEGVAVFNQIKARNPDLVGVLGDLGYASDLKWFKSTYGTLGNKVLCVQGNHESAAEDGTQSLQTETQQYCGDSFYVNTKENSVS